MRLAGLLLAFPLLASSAASASEGSCPDSLEITPAQAPRCVDQSRTVVGRLDNVGRSKGGNAYLNFCADFRNCPFSAVIFPKHRDLFPTLDRLVGSEIEVTGRLREYKGRPQIIIEKPEQLGSRSAGSASPDRLVSQPNPVAVDEPAPPPATPRRAPKLSASIPSAELPLPAVTVVAKPAVTEADPTDTVRPSTPAEISPAEVSTFVGQRARVRGRVARFAFEGNDLVARFERGSGNVLFVAVVAEPDVERLSRSAESWDGHDVVIEGDIALYDGVPSIFVRNPKQVTVISDR
jgi:DNA/RNA endonuclease YhcR with UshA esterase domain